MKTAVCLQHVPFEGPGFFQQCLHKRGYQIQSCLVPTDGLPQNPGDFLLIMGGPMSVNDSYGWIREEIEFIANALEMNIPLVGVCLGAQLLARALGVSVVQGPSFEIGMMPVTLTKDGEQDPVFQSMPNPMDVFQWHGEGFSLPQGTLGLIASKDYPVQAFRVHAKAYGLLFHLEMDESGVESLCRECATDVERGGIPSQTLRNQAIKGFPQLHKLADRLIDNLTAI